eukprot:778371-Amphidinium_carterae.1
MNGPWPDAQSARAHAWCRCTIPPRARMSAEPSELPSAATAPRTPARQQLNIETAPSTFAKAARVSTTYHWSNSTCRTPQNK